MNRSRQTINMLEINPYVAFGGNCRQAIEFYQSALGAELQFMQTFGESPMPDMAPADRIMHASVRLGASTVMMCDNPAPAADGESAESNISLAISIKDSEKAQALFNSLAHEGSVTMPMQKTFWSEAFGMVTDKFGVKWMVNCESNQPLPAQS